MTSASLARQTDTGRGWIAVTGSPIPSTLRTKSRRSYFEVFFESVEMRISSKPPVADGRLHGGEGVARGADDPLHGPGRPPCATAAARCQASSPPACGRSRQGSAGRSRTARASYARRSPPSTRGVAAVRYASTSTRVLDWSSMSAPSVVEPVDGASHLPRPGASSAPGASCRCLHRVRARDSLHRLASGSRHVPTRRGMS
jgi:hypothetical protein